MNVKYPNIDVTLTGVNGNAFAIIGAVTTALRRGGVDSETRDKFVAEATSGSYNKVLTTCMEWVNVN